MAISALDKHGVGLRESLSEVFKNRLEKHVSVIVFLYLILPTVNGVDQITFQVPSLLWILLIFSNEPHVPLEPALLCKGSISVLATHTNTTKQRRKGLDRTLTHEKFKDGFVIHFSC